MLEELWSSLIEFMSRFVVPDWGSLVALIPVFLAIPVALYVSWTIYRFATAGPTRRGMHRLAPVPPAGTHLPGPTFAPVLGAVGLLFLGFGFVAGGLWLLVGAVILVITLLYWGREALRDYDRVQGSTGTSAAVGMLPATTGAPPAGVHIPAPSFRPILVAIAMTMLVAGLIVGGWALVVGFLAVVLTGLGWLLDARREYRAVVAADTTGHLDAGQAPSWPIATFATLAVLVAVAVVFGSGVLPNSASDTGAGPATTAAPGGGATGGGPSAPASLPAADVTLAAKDTNFLATAITVPAGRAFTLAFDNRDALPHNVAFKDASGKALYTGEIFTGPQVKVYDVPALPAGSYTFVCSVHPNMTGTATAE